MGVATAYLALPGAARAETGDDSSTRVGGRVGAAWFAKSQSLAPEHLFKPSVAAHVLFPNRNWLQLGAGASGIVSASLDYQVAGVYGLARFVPASSRNFEWGLSAGVGVGTNPAIVHSDLKAEAPVLPFVAVATDGRWRLGESLALGVDLAFEQLSVVHLGLGVSYSL
jgi:hypothetical protein